LSPVARLFVELTQYVYEAVTCNSRSLELELIESLNLAANVQERQTIAVLNQ